MSDDIVHHRFRVPREDRSLLAYPEISAAAGLVQENRRSFVDSDRLLNGRSLTDLRSSARREAVDAARLYTSTLLRSELPEVPMESIVVSGHQPELFHVGVWA